MALQLGTGLKQACYIDGTKQALLNDITISQETNSNDIVVIDGWVGVSPGPVLYQVSGSCALLTSGPEFDFFKEAKNRVVHTLTIPQGADFIVLEGVFKNPSTKGGASQASMIDWTFTGREADDS